MRWMIESLPSRGVWIEIGADCGCAGRIHGRSPRGECGLKCPMSGNVSHSAGRSPRGECGLKSLPANSIIKGYMSLPSRGVWIEIEFLELPNGKTMLSLPSRGVWIEIYPRHRQAARMPGSLPSRGVWIEITAYSGIWN